MTVSSLQERQARSGFSFLELVIAVAVLALLASLVFVAYEGFLGEAKETTTRSKLKSLKEAIAQFHIHTGRYPRTLRDLAVKPADDQQLAAKWKRPYVEGDSYDEDAWNNKLVYKVTPGGKHKYELYSYGENGPGAPKEELISVWGKE